ncbi:MAG TPA: hypothetical protein VGF48_01195 [Thermoanaerobaculia bacterium]|jgi:hypothetical protein
MAISDAGEQQHEPAPPEPHEITSQKQRTFRNWFPRLKVTPATFTSARTPVYNCFAYAAGEFGRQWEPTRFDAYWPAALEGNDSVDACTQVYGALGYEPCELDATLEAGFEKIAFYVVRGAVQHAARQMPSGRWRSKIASFEDIEHETPHELECDMYGEVVLILKRRR